MARIEGLGHVALYTKDLTATLSFYEKLGGKPYKRCNVNFQGKHIRMVLVQLSTMTLEVVERPEYSELSQNVLPTFPHICLQCDDVDVFVEQLRAAGISSFESEKAESKELYGGIIRNIFLKGPSQERLELLQHM